MIFFFTKTNTKVIYTHFTIGLVARFSRPVETSGLNTKNTLKYYDTNTKKSARNINWLNYYVKHHLYSVRFGVTHSNAYTFFHDFYAKSELCYFFIIYFIH